MKQRLLQGICFLTLLGVLVACGAPRSPQVSRDKALEWHDPMEVRVIRHWDALRHSRDPHLSHLVEVEYLSGSGGQMTEGQRFVLPYDRWAMGEEPPERGEVLLMTPSQWVRGKSR